MAQQSQPPSPLKGFEDLQPGTYTTKGGSTLSYSHTPAVSRRPDAPVLVLLHGWPQTRYMWRYAVPMLVAQGRTLFVPDLPGYGYSTLLSETITGANSPHDRVSVGSAILEAVRAVYADGEDELKVVLIGHDRGGRVTQRLITPSTPSSSLPLAQQAFKVRILGAMLLDIVPYEAQWAAHGENPRAATRYWHWAFLPSPIGLSMVRAYGGERFCREILSGALAGSNDAAQQSFRADDAIQHYAACYERDEVIRGGAADYGAGAAEDWDAQREDLSGGRKIQVPRLVILYSEGLAKMHGGVQKVENIWKRWVAPEVSLDTHLLPSGVGHYIPEEALEETNRHIVEFLQGLGL